MGNARGGTMISPGPWRVGGQAHFDGEDFVELKTGSDIWSPDGPVTCLADWFCQDELSLMAMAPSLRDENQVLRARADSAEALLKDAGAALALAVSVLMRPVPETPDEELLDARMACLKAQDAIANRRPPP